MTEARSDASVAHRCCAAGCTPAQAQNGHGQATFLGTNSRDCACLCADGDQRVVRAREVRGSCRGDHRGAAGARGRDTGQRRALSRGWGRQRSGHRARRLPRAAVALTPQRRARLRAGLTRAAEGCLSVVCIRVARRQRARASGRRHGRGRVLCCAGPGASRAAPFLNGSRDSGERLGRAASSYKTGFPQGFRCIRSLSIWVFGFPQGFRTRVISGYLVSTNRCQSQLTTEKRQRLDTHAIPSVSHPGRLATVAPASLRSRRAR